MEGNKRCKIKDNPFNNLFMAMRGLCFKKSFAMRGDRMSIGCPLLTNMNCTKRHRSYADDIWNNFVHYQSHDIGLLV